MKSANKVGADEENKAAVTARPGGDLWVAAAFLFGIGVFFAVLLPVMTVNQPNARPADRLFWFGYGAILFLLLGGLGLWMVGSSPWEIKADADGVSWRIWSGRNRVAWGDVRDFYTRKVGTGSSAVERLYIVTDRETLWFTARWRNGDDLKRSVTRHAMLATTREWGMMGTRPDTDFPRTFGYQNTENRQRAWVAAANVALGAGLFIFFIAPKAPRLVTEMGWAWGLSMVAVMTLTMAGLPMLMAWAALWPTILDARDWRNETIVVNRNGLRWSDEQSGREAFLAWPDITDYGIGEPIGRLRGGSYQRVVLGANGEKVIFSFALENAALLCEIIAEQSVNARAHEIAGGKWRPLAPGLDPNILGGEAARWTGRVVGVGARVYHYRTRANRALLWGLWAFALLVLITVPLRDAGLTKAQNSSDNSLYVIAFLLNVIALWGTWRFYVARVETNGDGITQHDLFARRFLCWKDITGYEARGDAPHRNLIVRGGADNVTVRFWEGFIAYEDELKAEIARRAPRPPHGWDKGDGADKADVPDTELPHADSA